MTYSCPDLADEDMTPLLLVGKRRRRTVSEDLLADVKERKPSVADTYFSYQSFSDLNRSKRGPGRPPKKGKADDETKDKPANEELPLIPELPEAAASNVVEKEVPVFKSEKKSDKLNKTDGSIVKVKKKSSKKSHKHKKDKDKSSGGGEKSHSSKHKHKKHKQKSKDKSKKHKHDKGQRSTKFHLKESLLNPVSSSNHSGEKSKSSDSVLSSNKEMSHSAEKSLPKSSQEPSASSGPTDADLTVRIRTNSGSEISKPPVLPSGGEDSFLSADTATIETSASSKSTESDDDSLSDSSVYEPPRSSTSKASKGSPAKSSKKKKSLSKKKRTERLSSGESRSKIAGDYRFICIGYIENS